MDWRSMSLQIALKKAGMHPIVAKAVADQVSQQQKKGGKKK
jgi:hypothetical protein